MKEIGGHFSLELNDHGTVYHDDAVAVNSGRNALELICLSKEISKIYLPYYICNSIFPILDRNDIAYSFYSINKNLLPEIDHLSLNTGEAVLAVNYYGLLDQSLLRLAEKMPHLILDFSQSFFTKPTAKHISAFYSPRKFFGVPDGGFALIERPLNITEREISFGRISHLVKRIDLSAQAGFDDYQLNIASLSTVCNYLDLPFNYEVYSSMNIHHPTPQHAGEWALHINTAIGASTYINPPGGVEIYRKEQFVDAGIELFFLHPNDILYNQRNDTSIPYLSILDVLMFKSIEFIKEMLYKHTYTS